MIRIPRRRFDDPGINFSRDAGELLVFHRPLDILGVYAAARRRVIASLLRGVATTTGEMQRRSSRETSRRTPRSEPTNVTARPLSDAQANAMGLRPHHTRCLGAERPAPVQGSRPLVSATSRRPPGGSSCAPPGQSVFVVSCECG